MSTYFTGYLLVSETRLTDTGLYQCRASNSAGNDTANAKVIVTGQCCHGYKHCSIQNMEHPLMKINSHDSFEKPIDILCCSLLCSIFLSGNTTCEIRLITICQKVIKLRKSTLTLTILEFVLIN